MSLYRKHNDPEEVLKQVSKMEYPLEHTININKFKNSERCQKDGDLNLEKRVTVDTYFKHIDRKSGMNHDSVVGPSCSKAGECSGADIKQSAEQSMKTTDLKSVNPAVCFQYHNFVENNVERPQAKADWMSKLQIDN